MRSPRELKMCIRDRLYEILQALKIHGHMNDDHGGIVQYFEKLADIEVKKFD